MRIYFTLQPVPRPAAEVRGEGWTDPWLLCSWISPRELSFEDVHRSSNFCSTEVTIQCNSTKLASMPPNRSSILYVFCGHQAAVKIIRSVVIMNNCHVAVPIWSKKWSEYLYIRSACRQSLSGGEISRRGDTTIGRGILLLLVFFATIIRGKYFYCRYLNGSRRVDSGQVRNWEQCLLSHI